MSRKGVLIAMIVALAMAAAAWFLLGPKSSSTGATPETAPAARFFTFAPSDVRTLEITHPDGRVERLERDGQIWRLIIPARQDAA